MCYKILGNHSLKLSKLIPHLEKVYLEHKHKNAEVFKKKEACVKRQRLDTSGTFRQQSQTFVEASYAASLIITKQIKQYTTGENLVKPCAFEMARIVLGQENEKKLKQISLPNNTVQRWISDLADDIKQQVISDIENAEFGLFSIQLDESTDVSACSQLMGFCRYFTNTNIKEEFSFCPALEANTKAFNVVEKIEFFKCDNLKWENFWGMCSDGAPSMLGAKNGF